MQHQEAHHRQHGDDDEGAQVLGHGSARAASVRLRTQSIRARCARPSAVRGHAAGAPGLGDNSAAVQPWRSVMKLGVTAFALAALMCGASVASIGIRQSASRPAHGLGIQLETDVPRTFGDWSMAIQPAQVVNPQTQALLDSIYSQVLTRTYVHKDGYRIMLSMAFGDDQRGGLQAHRPEVCYPAQGFKVSSLVEGALNTNFGPIEVRRLTTNLGARKEPVTYWLTTGDQVIRNTWDKRFAQIKFAFTGQIPDGLLFRISSIDEEPARAFAMQQRFAADMISAVDADKRRKLSGLGTLASPS
ncbi:MAG: exosortase-associated protein EpsI, B-type [Caldimonas sp.]